MYEFIIFDTPFLRVYLLFILITNKKTIKGALYTWLLIILYLNFTCLNLIKGKHIGAEKSIFN